MIVSSHLNHFVKNVHKLSIGLKKRHHHSLHKNKNILDEMNINKAREIQIVYT